MAISVGTTNSSTGTGSVVISKPTVSVGDVLIASIGSAGTAITPPSGWTQIYASSTDASSQAWAGLRVIDGTEGSSFTWSAGSAAMNGCVTQYTGVDNTTPQDVAATTFDATSNSTATSLPTLTPVTSGNYLVVCESWSGALLGTVPAATGPGTFTVEFGPGAAAPTTTLQTLSYGSTTATGTVTLTTSASRHRHACLICLRPAAGGSTLSLPVAQVNVAAPAPSPQVQLSLPVAQENVAAPAPSPQVQLSLPVAQENVAALAPTATVGPVSLSLPVAQVNVAAPAPSPQVQLSLPVAQENVAALAPSTQVQLVLPVAQVGVVAPAPTVSSGAGPQTINLPVAQVNVAAFAPSPQVLLSLPVAQEQIAAPAPSPQLLLNLPAVPVIVTAPVVSPCVAIPLAVAQVNVSALPPTVSTGSPPRAITVSVTMGQSGVRAALQPGKWTATIT